MGATVVHFRLSTAASLVQLGDLLMLMSQGWEPR